MHTASKAIIIFFNHVFISNFPDVCFIKNHGISDDGRGRLNMS